MHHNLHAVLLHRTPRCILQLAVTHYLTANTFVYHSVGDAIGAFAAQMIKGSVPPGVYFPEEVPGTQYREEILCDISSDAITYSIESGKEIESFTFTV
jgi:hypothetical protein